MLRFDIAALHRALNDARLERSLSWSEMTAEINAPFAGTPSIPISVGTLREMPAKRSVTSAVVLQALRWLGRTPESFLTGEGIATHPGERLSDPDPTLVLRFDTRALHQALAEERRARRMTWKQVAGEMPGFTAAMLTNLSGGPLIGFPRVMVATQWLRRPAADFVRGRPA